MGGDDSRNNQALERRRSRPFPKAVLLLLIAAAVLVWRLAILPSPTSTRLGPITVVGNQRFVGQIGAALSLLERNDPEAYGMVAQYAPRIAQGRRSGMWAYRDPPTMEIGPRTAESSTTWLAGAIADDSFHAKLYADWRSTHGTSVPDAQWIGVEAERECCRHEVQVLKRIGAPKAEIDWCSRQDGTHPDVDGGEKLDWTDYIRRDW